MGGANPLPGSPAHWLTRVHDFGSLSRVLADFSGRSFSPLLQISLVSGGNQVVSSSPRSHRELIGRGWSALGLSRRYNSPVVVSRVWNLPAGWAWLLWSGLYWLLQGGTPFIRVPLDWVRYATLVSTLLLMASVLGLVFSGARLLEARRGLVLVFLIGGLLLWVGVLMMPIWLGWNAQNLPPVSMQVLARCLHGYLTIIWAIGLGALVSWVVREKNLLVPIVPLAALIDTLTVLAPGGFVKQVIEKAPEVAEKATVAIPAVPTPAQEVQRIVPVAVIGAGDFVFLALYAVCLYRFGLRTRATAIGLFLVLWLYLMVVVLEVAPALPALVPMAVVVLAVNWRQFQLSRQEKWASLIVVAVVVGLLGILFWRA